VAEYAAMATKKYDFDTVWLCDDLQYENTAVILTKLALTLNNSVGTAVTHPYGRNPIDLASSMSSISDCLEGNRNVIMGIGTGGTVQDHILHRMKPVRMVRETTVFLKRLFSGEMVEIDEFPLLRDYWHFKGDRRAKLRLPPEKDIPIVVAASGPAMLRTAGEVGDGWMINQFCPAACLPGLRRGIIEEAVRLVEQGRERGRTETPFKKIFVSHISVSRDERKAKDFAKRNLSYALSRVLTAKYLGTIPVAPLLGFTQAQIEPILDAYSAGLGVEGAARRVTDDMVHQSGFLVAGTPQQCVDPYGELVNHVRKQGFDHLIVGVPLGPDVPEAVQIITEEILPSAI